MLMSPFLTVKLYLVVLIYGLCVFFNVIISLLSRFLFEWVVYNFSFPLSGGNHTNFSIPLIG